MANASFTTFRTGLMTGLFDLDTAVIKVACIRAYTFQADHLYMSDVTGAGAVVNGTATLTGVTITDGVLDANDAVIGTTADPANHYLIVYQASAPTGGADLPANQQRLIWYFDTGTGLPIVPGTGSLTVTWPNTAGKIYKLGA